MFDTIPKVLPYPNLTSARDYQLTHFQLCIYKCSHCNKVSTKIITNSIYHPDRLSPILKDMVKCDHCYNSDRVTQTNYILQYVD